MILTKKFDENTVISKENDVEATKIEKKPTSEQEQQIRQDIKKIDPNKIALVFACDPETFRPNWEMIFSNESHATGLRKALYNYINDLPLDMIENLLEEINNIEVFKYLIGTTSNAYLAYKYNDNIYIYGTVADLMNSLTCVAILKDIANENSDCNIDKAQVDSNAVRDYFDFGSWTDKNGGENYAVNCFNQFAHIDFDNFMILHPQVLGTYAKDVWSPAGFLPLK